MAQNPRPSAPVEPPAAPTGTFQVARLLGFDVLIHWSWIFIFMLLTWSLATGYLPEGHPDWTSRQRWSVGAATSLLFFLSVLAHELAHSVLARRRGIAVQNITLYIFGGVSALGGEARRPRDEFWIAFVGPLTSFVLAVIFGGVWLLARGQGYGGVETVSGYLASINVALGVFNMLPGFPLDGGRVLRSIIWGARHDSLTATRITARVGQVIAGLLVAGGMLLILNGSVLNGVWFIFIGWFLWNAALTTYQQQVLQNNLGGLTVADLFDKEVPRVPPDANLRQLADDYILRQHRRAFFVAPETGDVLGLVTLSDLRHVPQEDWATTSVYKAMTPRDKLVTVTPRTEALAALGLMAERNINQLPVMENRDALGLLTRAGLIQAIQLGVELRPQRNVDATASSATRT